VKIFFPSLHIPGLVESIPPPPPPLLLVFFLKRTKIKHCRRSVDGFPFLKRSITPVYPFFFPPSPWIRRKTRIRRFLDSNLPRSENPHKTFLLFPPPTMSRYELISRDFFRRTPSLSFFFPNKCIPIVQLHSPTRVTFSFFSPPLSPFFPRTEARERGSGFSVRGSCPSPECPVCFHSLFPLPPPLFAKSGLVKP